MPDPALGAWWHRIVAHAAVDITRRRKVSDADELTETVASPFRDPAEANELRQRLQDALEKLPARQRAVIVMHDVEGFTHEEIGTMLGVTAGGYKAQLHRARLLLREALAR